MPSCARILACASAAGAALAIASCGGDGGVDSDDPASLAPADAPIYVQATIRPEGKLKRDAESLAATVSGLDDPTGRLIAELEESANEEPTASGRRISFEQDIEPWLGETAGVFATGFSGDPGAGIVQTTDPEATRQFIEDARQEGDVDRSYEGTDYVLDDDTAVGVVEDFLVLGDEPAFRRAVDVAGGVDSLGDQGEFTDALDQAPDESIADAYVSLEEVTREVRAEDPGNAQSLEASIGETEGKSVVASLVPGPDSLEIDASTNADTSLEFADLSTLIETFPADSLAAFGIPDLGGIVNRTIDQLEESGVEGLSREAIDEQLSQAGLSLDEITGALGDFGAFATGATEQTLQGAGVIASEDPEAADRLVGLLRNLATVSGQSGVGPAPVGDGVSLRDPEQLGSQPLIVTTDAGRIAIGYGRQATESALEAGGGKTLADDPTYREAVQALGGDNLTGYVAFPAIFRLAESLGAIADPGYQQARPYVDTLTYGVIGSGGQDDWQNSKIVVGVER